MPQGGFESYSPLNQQYQDFAQEVIELTNQERWKNGQLSPLKRQDNLMQASMWYAQWMADNDHFEHTEPNGRDFAQRADDYGYDWDFITENIGGGYITPQDAVDGWMNSPGHRANILNPILREIGVGYAFNQNYTPIIENIPFNLKRAWVQKFGTRANVYPVVINREARQTNSREVDLYVYGQGFATEMRFRNENGTWSAWEAYKPNKKWTLSEGNGTKTVNAEIRNASGTVRSNSDTIVLNLIIPPCFSDVSSSHPFNTYICNLKNDNVIGGFPDGTYKPSNNVDRGAMAKFIKNGFDIPTNTTCENFSDVSPSHPFYTYITSLKCAGVITGYPDGTYKPANSVNRGAMAKFIVNGAGLNQNHSCAQFSDVSNTHTFASYIKTLRCSNVIDGYPDGTYKPNNLVNRGAMAKFIDNARDN